MRKGARGTGELSCGGVGARLAVVAVRGPTQASVRPAVKGRHLDANFCHVLLAHLFFLFHSC